MNKIKISLICLGCPKNLADLENLITEIKNITITSEQNSEIVILNTCGFLKSARKEVFEIIKSLKNKKIIIIGCLSSWINEKTRKKHPQIYAVLTSSNYNKINEAIENAIKETKTTLINDEPNEFIEFDKKKLLTNNSFAYIKIAEGCNNKCGYCLIPYLKGKYRSRKMESIVKEAKDLIKTGIKEIILVAQDCGHYGIDIYKKKSLSELLKKLEKIKGDFWIRILYTYPEKVDTELIETIKNSKKICKYLDIPLQHGDSKILKSMQRPSDTKKLTNLIKKIRKEIPEISIRTSFIVGYPGEDKESFENLKKFIKNLKLDLVGIFEFSKEPHTKAYLLPNQISSSIKKKRRNSLMQEQQKISLENNKKLIGNKEKVLIEEFHPEQNYYSGRSQRFAPEIDGIIYFKSNKKLKINTFTEVEIIKSDEYDLYGEVR